MSFSAEIKEEISRLNTLKDKKQVKAELIGYLVTNNCSIVKNKIRFSTENEYNINRFHKLLSNLKIDYSIEMQGNNYVILFKKDNTLEEVLTIQKEKILICQEYASQIQKQELLAKAFIRGAFLGAGSVNNPKKNYHLEIVLACEENAEAIQQVMKQYRIKNKTFHRKRAYSIYIKEGEDISKCLALVGASSSVLTFEEIRVIKDMRNKVNRIVNCETANLNKTITASVRQIEDIKLIKQKRKFKELPDALQEIANIRQENPDATLMELGSLLKVPIGKSGVNHRLKKIQKYAEDLRR